jgi:hypothetical protein
MSDDYDWSLVFMLYHRGNVLCEIMNAEIFHTALAAPDAAWLRAQHPEAIRCKSLRHHVVIAAGAAERGRVLACRCHLPACIETEVAQGFVT